MVEDFDTLIVETGGSAEARYTTASAAMRLCVGEASNGRVASPSHLPPSAQKVIGRHARGRGHNLA